MYTKRLCCWLAGLISVCLMAGPTLLAAPLRPENTHFVQGWLADSDGDGVADAVDLCPGTASGTAVNRYGCPVAVASCDYTTSTVTLVSTGGSSGNTVSSRYVLTDNLGTILQINSVPTFTGLSGTATYMALAVTYDGNVSNLSIGNSLNAVSASCYNWSSALVFKVCVPTPPSPPTCDYQVGQTITLRTAGGSTGAGIATRYVLTNASGELVRVSSTPSFATAGLAAGVYTAYAVTYSDDGSLQNLTANGSNTLSRVTANCLNLSAGIALQLCDECVSNCLPFTVIRIHPQE